MRARHTISALRVSGANGRSRIAGASFGSLDGFLYATHGSMDDDDSMFAHAQLADGQPIDRFRDPAQLLVLVLLIFAKRVRGVPCFS